MDQVDDLICESEKSNNPLELDPARGKLFELFVTAHGAGFLNEDSAIDLSADGLCKKLASRWGLDEAAQASVASQENLNAEHLSKMRLLWSVMRMWMEWTYAWSRWEEFQASANAN
ncbi:MAG: hypothetical protein JKY95_05240 [Planctomycetaceae bacterium]|nr:hypothetical protein [Planctomycetaceae bacterium]